MLRPFIVKVSVLGYVPLSTGIIKFYIQYNGKYKYDYGAICLG